MTRLTLSEQLTQAQATIATQLQALESQQREIYALRQGITSTVSDAKAAMQVIITDLEKKIKDKETSYQYQGTSLSAATNELEQAHAVLDGVEGAPARDYERNDGYGSKVHRNVVTRLAGAFLAITKNGGFK